MPVQQTVVEWTELLSHAGREGFPWNYAHELLREFQGYDHPMEIYCEEISELTPSDDPYATGFFKKYKKDGDLNQMGRDIVYSFMQKYNLKKMLVITD